MADSREEGGALTIGGAVNIFGSLKNAAYSAVADSTAVAVATSAVDSLTLGGLTARPSEDGPAMTTEAYSKLPTPEKGSSGEVSDEMKKHLAFMDEKFEAVLKEFDAPKDATKLTEICDNGFTNVRHLPYELAGPGVFSVNYTLERPGLTPMEVNEQLWPDSRVKDGKMFRTGVKLRSYQGTDGAITEVHGAILGVPGGVNLFVSSARGPVSKHSAPHAPRRLRCVRARVPCVRACARACVRVRVRVRRACTLGSLPLGTLIRTTALRLPIRLRHGRPRVLLH